ncbi:uncharacterized protein [Cicer arietinum]|uniref:uncharacterized protein n=1 Tax=Cicer arietinum TaxID=3827 RepID=UPI003CC5FD80
MICASIMQVVKVDPSIKVKVIIAEIQALRNYTVTYRKAWIGKNKAIEQIYVYHENSLINGIRIFHRLFWAFVPCISAFKFCKPIVQVDGTWLYGKYKGTLSVAVAQDGNDNVIPIAYALVEDRHESIKSAYNDPNNGWQDPPSKHMFCVRHISQKFASEFKDNALKKKVTRSMSLHIDTTAEKST